MTDRIWAIVPAKNRFEAKSRLASVLTSQERTNLATNLLLHTLQVLQVLCHKNSLAGIIMVSSDQFLLNLAAQHKAIPILEPVPSSLNSALDHAANIAISKLGATQILVLFADLPFLTADDLAILVARPNSIAPDRYEQGTNALLLEASLAHHYGFGSGSFSFFCERFKAIHICQQPTLAFDLDYPQDWQALPVELKAKLLKTIHNH